MAKEKPKSNRGKFLLLMLLGGGAAAVAGLAQFDPDKLSALGPLAENLTGEDKLKLRGMVFAIGALVFLLFGKLTFGSKKKKK